MNKYAADRFWHVILEVPDGAAMRNVLELARTRTPATSTSPTTPIRPRTRLPTYFGDEIAALAR
jgi:hypothetical protein